MKGAVSRIVLVALIAVILIVGVVTGVALTRRGTATQSSSTSSSPYSSVVSPPSSSETTTKSANTSSLVVEEGQQPDSLDPAVTFQTSGWEVVEQVYQGLVAPDGTSVTTYVGVLARNWSVSQHGMTYTFTLRQGVHFSNGDPFNAYVEWFSVYRTLIMNQAPAFILGQNLATTNGVNFTVNATTLNSMNYFNPSPSNLSVMEYPLQSVQVLGPYEMAFHLGYGYNGESPYNAFLATLSTPMAYAVDPAVVEAHGGVVANQTNSWMQSNALGTGFYALKSWISGQSVTLVRNPDYWAADLPVSTLNYALKPAIIPTVIIYYKSASARVADIKSGVAQMIEAPVQDYQAFQGIAGVNATVLPIQFGSSEGIYYVYMDPNFTPFSNPLVREAVSYAIDYAGLIKSVLDGYGIQYTGPVPPGFPFYAQATAGLSPYRYDPVKAAELLAQAGYKASLPNGTILNPNGKSFPVFDFLYTSDSALETQTAQIIAAELQAVGIPASASPLSYAEYTSVIYTVGNSTAYPMGLAYYSEDFTASIDYVSALTENGYVSASAYYNATVFNWTVEAATSSSNQTISGAFSNITKAMYDQHVLIWLFVPEFMAVHADDIAGMIPNPAGSGMGYFMFYNTIYYT
jgi:peptide/nickel transport system substrate-binding protein